jgi:hypothetical protein
MTYSSRSMCIRSQNGTGLDGLYFLSIANTKSVNHSLHPTPIHNIASSRDSVNLFSNINGGGVQKHCCTLRAQGRQINYKGARASDQRRRAKGRQINGARASDQHTYVFIVI